MQITRENNGELKEIIKIKVDKEDYDQKVTDTLSDYRKKAKMDGFRPGKVPFGLIRKMYGKAVTLDEVNKLISENLTSYIRDEGLDILGEPIPYKDKQEQIDFDNQDEFEFYFEVGLSPEIDPEKLSEVSLPYYSIYPDEDLIEKTIKGHQDNAGEHIEVEQAGEEDIVQGELFELDEEGRQKEDGLGNEEALISIQLIKDPEIKDQFLGAQEDDIIDFNLRKALPNDTELSSLLNTPKENIEDNQSDFRLIVKTIKRFKKGEINQELFDKIYGEGTVNSEDEYRNKIIEDLKANFERESEYKFMNDVHEKLIEFYQPELPDSFLKNWFIEKDENLTSENIEEEYKKMREGLQWEVISSKLAKHFEVKVEEEEIKDYAKEFLSMQFQQYGMSMSSLPEGFMDNYANELLQKPEERQRMENAKKEEKLAKTLKDYVTLETKEISFNDYKEMIEPSEEKDEQAETPEQQESPDEAGEEKSE